MFATRLFAEHRRVENMNQSLMSIVSENRRCWSNEYIYIHIYIYIYVCLRQRTSRKRTGERRAAQGVATSRERRYCVYRVYRECVSIVCIVRGKGGKQEGRGEARAERGEREREERRGRGAQRSKFSRSRSKDFL